MRKQLFFESCFIAVAGEGTLLHFNHRCFFQHFEGVAAAAFKLAVQCDNRYGHDFIRCYCIFISHDTANIFSPLAWDVLLAALTALIERNALENN